MKSESYLMGVRIGMATGGYKILERIMKASFNEEYKLCKYKLRRLSDIEVEELIMELAVATDSCIIKKYMI